MDHVTFYFTVILNSMVEEVRGVCEKEIYGVRIIY